MTPGAYYNEIDPFAAAWLRNLVAANLIAPGDVDERDIRDVRPDDLRGYTQCHFFAGIGGWSVALRRAGWPDERPVWTGSCPCQPFSAAGRGGGFDDERHLWPFWFHLIEQCRPERIFGEQVASKDGLTWLDLVQADLEGTNHTFGALDLCSAGFGAPHIRQRLHFVAIRERERDARRLGHADRSGLEGQSWHEHDARGRTIEARPVAPSGSNGGLADAGRDGDSQHTRELPRDEGQHALGSEDRDYASVYRRAIGFVADTQGIGVGTGLRDRRALGERTITSDHGSADELGHTSGGGREERGDASLAGRSGYVDGTSSSFSGMADADGGNTSAEREQRGGQHRLVEANGRPDPLADAAEAGRGLIWRRGSTGERDPRAYPDLDHEGYRPGPTNGAWEDADWLFCRDGKWRPVEPGTFPLAHGIPNRVGLLRGYGNAINIEPATEFIAAFQDLESNFDRGLRTDGDRGNGDLI